MKMAGLILLMFVFFLAVGEIDSDGQEFQTSDVSKSIVLGLAKGAIDYKKLASYDVEILDQRVLLSFHEAADSLLRGKQEWTPLTASIACDNYVAATVLVLAGADVNRSRSDFGNSPLWMTLAAGNEDCQVPRLVKLLLDYGADPNFAPKHVIDGPFFQTPLHIAASSGDLAVVRILIEGGANRFAKNSYGHTPADLARQTKGTTEETTVVAIVELLESNRADTNGRK